jgi:hypothetical protein
MVTKKLYMLEIAVGTEAGVVYRKTGTKEMPRDVLTWQDISDRRIWVHSRQTEDGYKPISIEVQNLGRERHPDGIDPSEARARAALAAVVPADLTMPNIGHADIRNVPIGHVMHRNSILISNEQTRVASKSERKLKLVNDENEEYRVLKMPITHDGKRVATLSTEPIRASKSDSILIAYMYAQMASAGNKKAASGTAFMLGIESKFVYTALRNARKKGWLTTSGIGSSGGTLTEAGKTEFEKSGRTRYEEFLKKLTEGIK